MPIIIEGLELNDDGRVIMEEVGQRAKTLLQRLDSLLPHRDVSLSIIDPTSVHDNQSAFLTVRSRQPLILVWKISRTAALQDMVKIGITLTATRQSVSKNRKSNVQRLVKSINQYLAVSDNKWGNFILR